MSVLCLVLIVTTASAAFVYESNWHLQPNSDTVTEESARLDRLHFDLGAELASAEFRDGALCIATDNTNAELDVVPTPQKGSVAMRLRLQNPRAHIYELFLIAGPWSLSVFKFNFDDSSPRVGVFPATVGGFHDKFTPLDEGNATLPSEQDLLWVVFTWNPQLMVAPAAVWWNLDGKFNSSTSTVSLHSGVQNAMSSNVSLFFRYQTSVCIEGLVVSDSITDPQRALSELEEKTGNRAVMTTMEATMTAMSTASASTTSTSTSLSMASTTPKTSATAQPTSVPSAGLDGGTLGAIIGGCIAGVLVIAGVVFLACRSRRQPPAPKEKKDANAIYGALELGPKAPDYGHGNID
jgi:hypothetical protein